MFQMRHVIILFMQLYSQSVIYYTAYPLQVAGKVKHKGVNP